MKTKFKKRLFKIVLCTKCFVHYAHAGGVYLSLKGMNYTDKSFIFITEIGQTNTTSMELTNTTSNNGLQCITNWRPCCKSEPNRHGEWFFPDGGMVPGTFQGGVTTFYRNRGDDGTVNLNRLNSSIMMPTGRFCCVVPDNNDTNTSVCTNIRELIGGYK